MRAGIIQIFKQVLIGTNLKLFNRRCRECTFNGEQSLEDEDEDNYDDYGQDDLWLWCIIFVNIYYI